MEMQRLWKKQPWKRKIGIHFTPFEYEMPVRHPSRNESSLQLYEVVTIIVPLVQTVYQHRKVNFPLFTQEATASGFKPRHSDTTASDFKHRGEFKNEYDHVELYKIIACKNPITHEIQGIWQLSLKWLFFKDHLCKLKWFILYLCLYLFISLFIFILES